jgi:hypothetical protein
LRDEEYLSRLHANPLQDFRQKAIANTHKVAFFLYKDTGQPIPVDKLAALLAVNYGYDRRKVSDYLENLEKADRIVWNRDSNTIIPSEPK